jgi:glycosyltransferase involved in cell wall biosynthesis
VAEYPMKKISIIIPAHNEEKYIARCLESIRTAESRIDLPVEKIVVLNRCTDRTEDIAREFGAEVLAENEKNLSRIRNAGCRVSSGDVLVTIDADSWMSPNMLREVLHHLQTEKYIGGGVRIKPERISIGIVFSLLIVAPYMLKARISAGMFWLYKHVFDAVGGFEEQYISVEDYHFALKLKQYGKKNRLKFGTIRKECIVTSCRKFDQFGDWYLFKNPKTVREIFRGTNRKIADGFYYDIKR